MPLQRSSASLSCALFVLACQPTQLVAVDGCSASPVACHASAEDEAGGALGLLQFASGHASSHEVESTAEVGHSSEASAHVLHSLLEARGLGRATKAPFEIDCTEHKTLCEAPFNCQNMTTQERQSFDTRMATEDGHSNLRTWCMAPDYEDGIAKLCIQGHDLKSNAQVTYNKQVADGAGELDGSYCFLEGYCVDTDVTYDTTVEEAEALCDAKYGHENWTAASSWDILKVGLQHPLSSSEETGFHTRDLSTTFAMLACAMGNYHCDVVYCRDTYCKNPHYVEKYGHFLKDYGWA